MSALVLAVFDLVTVYIAELEMEIILTKAFLKRDSDFVLKYQVSS